jgi:hypothetical protein
MARGILERAGGSLDAATAREAFARLAATVPDYTGLDYKVLGSTGRSLPLAGSEAQEARP